MMHVANACLEVGTKLGLSNQKTRFVQVNPEPCARTGARRPHQIKILTETFHGSFQHAGSNGDTFEHTIIVTAQSQRSEAHKLDHIVARSNE